MRDSGLSVVILGTSTAAHGIDVQAQNAGISAASIQEIAVLAESLCKNIFREAVFCLDFFSFLSPFVVEGYIEKCVKSAKDTKVERSYQKTLKPQPNGFLKSEPLGSRGLAPSEKITRSREAMLRIYEGTRYNDDSLVYLAKALESMQIADAFVSPLHESHLEILEASGLLPSYERWLLSMESFGVLEISADQKERIQDDTQWFDSAHYKPEAALLSLEESLQ